MSDADRTLLKERFGQLSAAYRQCQDSPEYRSRIHQVQEQRRDRILNTYGDLRRQAQYRRAVEFLANDLFGHNGLTEHGAQLEKAADTTIRVLPEPLLDTVAKAVEFTVLSMQLDLQLTRILSRMHAEADDCPPGLIDQATKETDNSQGYRRQVDLVLDIGEEIGQVVHKPFITTALKMCRGPARWMGLSDLQHYLEHGVEAFRNMKDPAHFFQVFEAREKAFLDQVFMNDE